MQITVTLEPDVAEMLERRIRKTGLTFKQVVDRVLPVGLDAMDPKKKVRTRKATPARG